MRSDAERRRLILALELEHDSRRAVRAHQRRCVAVALLLAALIAGGAAELARRIVQRGCEVIILPFSAGALLICRDRGGVLLEILR